MNPEIKPEDNKHNCQLCKTEWLGRCLTTGNDVSIKNKPCQFHVFAGTKEKLEKINKKKGVIK